MTCRTQEDFVDTRLSKVLTQYRESPKLLFLLKTYLSQVFSVYDSLCRLPDFFDLTSAEGDQLTLLGKRMGFPRCHCVCDVQPVFGFSCGAPSDLRQITGFCEGGTWSDCGEDGVSEICITDDNLYRKLLISRSYQMQSFYSLETLETALKTIYGDQAKVLDAGRGRVVLAPFRELTEFETAILQIVPRVLPVAPGITTRWHFGVGGVFGFGNGWSGFCETVSAEGLPLATEDGNIFVTENGEPITTGPLFEDSEWMCEIDLRPYSC